MIGHVARKLTKAFKHFGESKTWFGCDNSQVISAMEHSPIQTCVLKMNVKCKDCQEKVKKALQRIHGVHSINIDANEGKVAVSSTIDPHLVIAMLARAGQKAELLWEPERPQAMNNPTNCNDIDRDHKLSQIAQLEEFAKIPGLKQVELNQSGNIKMIFRDNDDHDLDSNSARDHHHQAEGKHEAAGERATPPPPPSPPEPPSPLLNKNHCVGGDGASSSGSHPCCHDRPEVKFACSEGSFGIRYIEEPFRPGPYFALPPPHFVHPFALPPNYHIHRGLAPPPPPLREASPSTYGIYSPEDNDACHIM